VRQARAQSSQVEDKRPTERLVQPIVPEFAMKLNLSEHGKNRSDNRTRWHGENNPHHCCHPVLAVAAESAAQKSSFQPGPKETVEVIEFKFSGK